MTTSAIPNLLRTRTHIHTPCSFNKARLPQATRAAYLLLPCLPRCYQPGLVHTYTHTLPLSVKHTGAVSESLHTQTRERMLWGLISVLRGLAATSQAHIPGAEATETKLCDRSADEHRLYTSGDDLCNTGGLRAAPTMSAYTGHDGPQRQQPLEEREHNRNTDQPVNADSQGPRRTGTDVQLRLSRFVQLSLALMLEAQLAVMHIYSWTSAQKHK